MKKFAGLFLAAILVLSGCSSSKDKGGSVTCSIEQEGNNISYDLGYNADEILKTIKGTIKVTSDEEIDDSQMEMVKSLYGSIFDEIDGIDYKMERASNKKDVTIIIDIDLGKYDAETDQLGMFGTLEDKDEITKVKVKDLIKEMKNKGAECGSVK